VAAGRLVVQLRWIIVLTCWALFLLGFVEPPSWCREASHLDIIANQLAVSNKDEYGDCEVLLRATGTAIDGQEDRELYPSTNSMVLTFRESKYVEILGLCVVSFFMLLKLADDGFKLNLFFFPGKKRRLNTFRLTVLACLSFCTVIDAIEPKPILRMLLLASFLRRFQKEFFTVVQMIPQMSAPLSILAIFILFYGWFGTVMFYQTEQGTESFPNIFESCWTLWIMVRYRSINEPFHSARLCGNITLCLSKGDYCELSRCIYAFAERQQIGIGILCQFHVTVFLLPYEPGSRSGREYMRDIMKRTWLSLTKVGVPRSTPTMITSTKGRNPEPICLVLCSPRHFRS